MNLTSDQLATIDRHLRKENWLLNEALIAELPDHYATGIADRMVQGEAFDKALIEVYEGFGFASGLLKLEEEFVEGANKTAWTEYKRVLQLYGRLPRLLILPIVALAAWYLLSQYWHVTLLLLFLISCGTFVLVNWPWWRWNLEEWNFDWKNRSLKGYYQRKLAGVEKMSALVSGAGLNLSVFVYFSNFPVTWTRPYNTDSPTLAALWLTVSFLTYASVAEFTYRYNPLLKRLI